MFSQGALDNLSNGLDKLGIQVSNQQTQLLIKYWELVEKTNQTMNLTRITGDMAVTHHLLDAASVIPTITDKTKALTSKTSLVDIGTGCGVPGVVLKILLPNLEVLLVDSLLKRVRFLQGVIEELNLTSITAVHGRAEDLSKKKEFKNKFDISVTRAVANLKVVLEYSVPFVKPTGIALAMKGPKVFEEMEAMSMDSRKKEKQISIIELSVPYLDEKRFLAITC